MWINLNGFDFGIIKAAGWIGILIPILGMTITYVLICKSNDDMDEEKKKLSKFNAQVNSYFNIINSG